MHSSHYFFALTLPDDVKANVSKISERLKADFPFKSWVHRNDYHITLAFLGNADQRQLAEAVSNVKGALKDFQSFQVALNQVGTFGRPDSPRILWVNPAESSALSEVRDKVYTACEQAGFQLESRPFKPHITLARKWIGEQEFDSRSVKECLVSLLPGPVFTLEEVALYRTHLDRTPKYEKVESVKLI